jgi:hypothetical protein
VVREGEVVMVVSFESLQRSDRRRGGSSTKEDLGGREGFDGRALELRREEEVRVVVVQYGLRWWWPFYSSQEVTVGA